MVFSSEERAVLESRAREAAAPRAVTRAGSEGEAVIVVRCGPDSYGFRGADIRAVAALTKLSPLPLSPPHVAGLTAFRGTILVVFHLHAVLGAPPTLSEYGRMVVLDDECAIAVDAIERSEEVDALRPPPPGLHRAAALLEGITASGVALIDVRALCGSDALTVDISPNDVARFVGKP
jgi:chemotaxis signal transduction protein